MKAPFIESERLTLKALSMEHLSSNYLRWLNDPEVYRFLETQGGYTREKLAQYLKEVEAKEILFWGVHLKETGQHIGNVKVDPVQERHGLGEFGILMGEKSEWGKGYAKEASAAIIDFCFRQLGLRKITLGVVEDNSIAVGLYRQLGFVLEGVYRDHGLYNGKYCNVLRMALFKPDGLLT